MPVGPRRRAVNDIISHASANRYHTHTHKWHAGRAAAQREPEQDSRKSHSTSYSLVHCFATCRVVVSMLKLLRLHHEFSCYLQNFSIAVLLLSLYCHLKTLMAYGMY